MDLLSFFSYLCFRIYRTPDRCGIDCASSLRLRFKGQYATITPSMDEDKVAAKLMALPTVKVVTQTADSLAYSCRPCGYEQCIPPLLCPSSTAF